MKKGKVQTNDYGVNVLVEHQDCTSKHYSHLNKDVLWEKISFLKKIEGFTVSNVYSKESELPSNLKSWDSVKSWVHKTKPLKNELR